MTRCSDPRCPYGLEAYGTRPEHRGLCLNCIDDELRDLEQFHMDRDIDENMFGDWRALAAGAQSAETNEDLAQSEGRQSGGEAVTPNPSNHRRSDEDQGQ